jgi:hypothetical protein
VYEHETEAQTRHGDVTDTVADSEPVNPSPPATVNRGHRDKHLIVTALLAFSESHLRVGLRGTVALTQACRGSLAGCRGPSQARCQRAGLSEREARRPGPTSTEAGPPAGRARGLRDWTGNPSARENAGKLPVNVYQYLW